LRIRSVALFLWAIHDAVAACGAHLWGALAAALAARRVVAVAGRQAGDGDAGPTDARAVIAAVDGDTKAKGKPGVLLGRQAEACGRAPGRFVPGVERVVGSDGRERVSHLRFERCAGGAVAAADTDARGVGAPAAVTRGGIGETDAERHVARAVGHAVEVARAAVRDGDCVAVVGRRSEGSHRGGQGTARSHGRLPHRGEHESQEMERTEPPEVPRRQHACRRDGARHCSTSDHYSTSRLKDFQRSPYNREDVQQAAYRSRFAPRVDARTPAERVSSESSAP
jgi:hypothetical protein